MHDDRSEERRRAQRRSVREYRRLGYEVLEHPRGDVLPAFLRGFSPDLVVLSDDDKAVVEIRTREEVVGSNEFMKLAETIEGQKGWRLELVSLGRRKPEMKELSKEGLERLLAFGLETFDAGKADFALIFVVSVLDELVRDTAMRHRVRSRNRAVAEIVDDLVTEGIVDEATGSVVDRGLACRSVLVHGEDGMGEVTRSEFAGIVAACRAVWASMELATA